MDILEKARQHFPLETTGKPFQTHELQRIKVVREMSDEIELLRKKRDGLREALQKIVKLHDGYCDGDWWPTICGEMSDVALAALKEGE